MRFLFPLLLVVVCLAQDYRLGDAITVQPGSKPVSERHAAAIEPAVVPSTWYDTSNRAAIAEAYKQDFLPTRLVPTGWTGSVVLGQAGDVSAAYRGAVNQRINWFRAMAGVPAWVAFDATFNSKAQKGALMIAANNALSHTPPPAWIWYTVEGAEALGNSNICYGAESDPACIAAYIGDQFANNAAVGHRRWILYPQTRFMGTGDLPHNGNLWNVLWVFDNYYGTQRPQTRDEFVAWPPKGYVPHQVVYPRWSFSYSGADFSQAAVTLTRDGTPVPVNIEPLATGAGENTIVWVPAGQDTSTRFVPVPPGADQTYDVTVSNVRIGGVPRTFTYRVIVFNPEAGVVVSPDPQTASFTAAGGNSGFWTNLDPPGAALPTRVASASWIQLTGVAQGGTYVFYTVAPNTGPARTGTITVGGAVHTITQAGIGCSFNLSSNGVTVTADNASGQFDLTASGSNCTWTASSNRPWLQVYPLNGAGNAAIYYTVFPNFSGTQRTGTITIADRQLTVIQQAGAGTVDERFVRLLYFNFFGRLPAASEVAFQVGSGLSRSVLASNFLNSLEFNEAARFVAGLYVGILNRDAEYGGWLFQRNALATAQTNPDLQASTFVNGPEFTLKNGNLPNADLVRLLYRQILGREASPEEVTWRVGLLASGMTRATFARDLLKGTEFRIGKNARLLAFLLYATLLNRDPISAEYIMRRDQIAANPSDANVRAIIADILGSAEFNAQLQ